MLSVQVGLMYTAQHIPGFVSLVTGCRVILTRYISLFPINFIFRFNLSFIDVNQRFNFFTANLFVDCEIIVFDAVDDYMYVK